MIDMKDVIEIRKNKTDNGHKTVPMQIGGEICNIDVKIAPLVAELNRVGLKTISSCQGVGNEIDAHITIELDKGTSFRYFPDIDEKQITILWKSID